MIRKFGSSVLRTELKMHHSCLVPVVWSGFVLIKICLCGNHRTQNDFLYVLNCFDAKDSGDWNYLPSCRINKHHLQIHRKQRVLLFKLLTHFYCINWFLYIQNMYVYIVCIRYQLLYILDIQQQDIHSWCNVVALKWKREAGNMYQC